MSPEKLTSLTDWDLKNWAFSIAASEQREEDMAYWKGLYNGLKAARDSVG